MEWPPSSPDVNPIKNLWSIVKMKLYEGCQHYNSKTDMRSNLNYHAGNRT